MNNIRERLKKRNLAEKEPSFLFLFSKNKKDNSFCSSKSFVRLSFFSIFKSFNSSTTLDCLNTK